jgi:hypothetical protein
MRGAARIPRLGRQLVKELTDTQIDELVDAALEVAWRVVQDELGVKSEDLAVIFWSGDSRELFKSLFVARIRGIAEQEK